jgi:PAS domain S-box-containing protein
MKDEDKTKEQLIDELGEMRREIAELRALEAERKWAEEELGASEERYRTLFEQSRDAVYITTRDGKFVEINTSFLDLFGYCREEILGLDVRETYVNPADRWEFQQEIEQKGSVRDFPLKLRKKDGIEMDCLLTATVRRDAEGGTLGYQGIIRDITERKRAEEELKQSEKRYRSLVEDINDGYFILQDEEFVYFNRAFANILGYTREENLVRKFLRFLSPKYLDWRSRDDQRGEEDREQGGEDELEILGEGGKNLVLEIRSRVIDYNGRSGIAGIFRDITERKKAERDLRERIEELEKWYRLIVDRELKMTHLKERIQELNSKLKLVRERYGVNI